MVALLSTATVLGLKFRAGDRNATLGMGLASLGALITITESVVLVALSRNGSIGGFLYQQVQFSVAYLAFAFFLYGMDRGLLSRMFFGDKLRRARILAWGTYSLMIAVSSLFLFNPASYKVTIVGSQVHVAQQLVFWFPLFFALLAGALTSIFAILRSESPQRRTANVVWYLVVASFLGHSKRIYNHPFRRRSFYRSSGCLYSFCCRERLPFGGSESLRFLLKRGGTARRPAKYSGELSRARYFRIDRN